MVSKSREFTTSKNIIFLHIIDFVLSSRGFFFGNLNNKYFVILNYFLKLS